MQLIDSSGQLIALDTSVYFATADADQATRAGLVNMGFSGSEAFSWITTDTFQLLNQSGEPGFRSTLLPPLPRFFPS